MTPCEKLGYKVGDKFEVVKGQEEGFRKGEIITLRGDDGSECPEFSGNHYDGDGWGFIFLAGLKPLTAPKLRPAKQALADAIRASGKGWPDGANWAAQDKEWHGVSCRVGLYKYKPFNPSKGGTYWLPSQDGVTQWVEHNKLLPNWHQTVLSRDEYFSAYPEKVEPVAKSTAVGDDETNPAAKEELKTLDGVELSKRRAKMAEIYAPSTDTLLSMWQSAQVATCEARVALEAAEQAEREAEEAVKAALGKYGWGESVADADGWIEWSGDSQCPVDGKLVVQLRFRNGELSQSTDRRADSWTWSHDYNRRDIMAYRIIKP